MAVPGPFDIETSIGADGAPICFMPFSDALEGRPGFIHGGAIAALLDVAIRAALDAAHPAEDGLKRQLVSMTVRYLRPALCVPTHASAVIVKNGSRIVSLEADMWSDDREAPIASGFATFGLRGAEA